MSWRETLGVTNSTEKLYTHNSHNAQKSTKRRISADIADSASGISEEESSKLLEILADVCRGLAITPMEVKEALAPEDINDWCDGAISSNTLLAFAHSLGQRQMMGQGKPPTHYTEHATCKHCGPIWLWFSGEILSCPWCRNRVTGRPIPRPCCVVCSDCIHFNRIDHPRLGHCARREPEAVVGLWDTTRRYCTSFSPRVRQAKQELTRSFKPKQERKNSQIISGKSGVKHGR